jgi:prepilin-type N-terminal cleavage/methylation domain-containing protein
MSVRKDATVRGFSLIEILVVMGIITLLVALALPAFNFISGSRSTEAASNRLSAVFGIARANAIGVQRTQGVAIYHDKDTERTTAVLVELRDPVFPTYAAGTPGPPPVPVSYTFGQYVVFSGDSYVCIQAYADAGAAETKPNFANSQFWRELVSLPNRSLNTTPVVEIVAGGDFTVLPSGIDVRAVGNTYSFTLNVAPFHRYFSPAVFLFDASGHVVSTPIAILGEGILGQKMNSSKTVPVPPTTPPTPKPFQANSGIGLVVYDAEQFTNANPVATATVVSTENWLDENATPSMVNRYNGTLVRGE